MHLVSTYYHHLLTWSTRALRLFLTWIQSWFIASVAVQGWPTIRTDSLRADELQATYKPDFWQQAMQFLRAEWTVQDQPGRVAGFTRKGGLRRMLPVLAFFMICCLLFMEQAHAQTYTTKEYLYVNEPSSGVVMKFLIGSNVALTEVTGANGGPHWYPGTGTSELPSPHGLATDLNGKLYIAENGNKGKLRRLSCDGVMEPVSASTITTTQVQTQNFFSIGNTIYHNSDRGPTAYNSCTGAMIGKMCFSGWANFNQWGLSYNAVTQMVYATDKDNGAVWVFSRSQLEASIATGGCVSPFTAVPPSSGFPGYGVVSDNAGNFYVVKGKIYKFNAAGQVIGSVDIQAKNGSPIGITWSATTNRLYISNLNSTLGEDCISTVDAATMTYLGTAVPNPANATSGSKAIQILREACPVNLPATFTRNVCGAIGKKFYLNQEAFSGADGIVCGSSWTPTAMTGMTFDACDNSVTITGEGCGTFTLNIAAVSSTGCPAQTATFTICNTFPPNITVTTQATCKPTGKYTLTGAVSVSGTGTPTTGTLTVRVPGGGSQTFNAPFTGVINYSIPNVTTTGGTRSVYAEFSDSNCSKEQIYTEPVSCPVTCDITLTPTVSGCYSVTGASKATVSVEVSWENIAVSSTANDASDAITVTFAGQTKTINPGSYTSTGGNGTIVSPQVVAFEVPADASSQTAQAFIGASYVAATCKVQQTGVILPAACLPIVCIPGQLGGTVWNDFNADGTKQPGETTGVPGVTVNAYDCAGTLIASTITDASGKYVMTNIPLPSYPIRVEFTNLPAYAGMGTVNGTDGRTTVQFVNAADCNVDLGILDNNDYCQTNPKIIVPCYLNGDPQNAGSATDAAIVSMNYDLTGSKTVLAKIPQVGTVWGEAYNKYNKQLYIAAFVRRHSGLGPDGLGAIYKMDVASGTTSTFVDLITLGVNLGSIPSNTSRGLGDKTTPTSDPQAFTAVGKVGMGGLGLSEDGQTLYFVNLFEKKLHRVSTSSPTSAPGVAIPDPGCTGGTARPWALKIYKGKAYVGVVCDALTSQNKSELRAYVYQYDLAANTFNNTPVFDFPLTYPKGYSDIRDSNITGWYPWSDDGATVFPSGFVATPYSYAIYQQPILSDIEFDIDGSMVMAFADRAGFQLGEQNYNLAGQGNYSNTTGGDILRAFSRGGTFVLENNAKAGPNVGYGQNNNQGPGFGEFYNDDFYYQGIRYHSENALGGLALRPGSGETINTVIDPETDINGANGFRILNNSTGVTSAAYTVYRGGLSGGLFSKSAGLGDVVLTCDLPTYLEIGNRLWVDTNKDGIQDPCEKSLANVNVALYQGNTLVATTTTNANGEYYFNNNATTSTIAGTVSTSAILPNTAYTVRFGTDGTTSQFNSTTNQLTVDNGKYTVTTAFSTQPTANTMNDSNAQLSGGFLSASVSTGAAGSVNHTIDAGFICVPTSVASVSVVKATCPAASTVANNDAQIQLTGIVCADKVFLVPAGGAVPTYTATGSQPVSASAASFMGLANPATAAGQSYSLVLYNGPCCYTVISTTLAQQTCVVLASLGDYVFEDVNANGVQDGADKPIPGVTVTLLSSGTLVASTTTDASGLYSFTGLTPGVPYSVSFTAPVGFTATTKDSGTNDALDSDGNPATGVTGVYTLTANENNITVDMGYYKPASLGDKVFADNNRNGIQDTGDTPIPGVTVTLVSNGTVVATTTTLSSGTAIGCYSFTGLTPGVPYSVSFTTPAGYSATTPNAPGSTTATDSDPINGVTTSVTLASGENNPTLDAGFYLTPAMSISLTSAPVCNPVTNQYTATATVSLTSASAGALTITDNGTTIGTISVTAGQATATVSVTGLSNAASHTLLASFNGLTASTTYTTPVACTVCSTSLVTTTLPDGQVGTAYNQTIQTTGGTTPYAYTVSTGTLPAGLSLDPATGIISGTPTSALTSSFTVQVTDSKSCSDTQPLTIVVECPPLTVTATSATICAGEIRTLTASGATTYVWSTGANTTSIVVSATATTTYSVTGSTSAGCSATATGTLTVNGQPQINSITQSTACVGTVASLTVNATNTGAGILEYSLNGGTFTTSNSFTISAPASVTATVVVRTQGSSCTATESVVVNCACATPVSLTFVPTTLQTCAGLPVSFTVGVSGATSASLTSSGTGSFSQSVISGATTVSYTPSLADATAGSLTLTLTSADPDGAGACVADQITRVLTISPAPSVSATSTSVCIGESAVLTASGASTYVWSNGATTQSISVSVAGTYSVTGISSAGCTATASGTLTIYSSPTLSPASLPGGVVGVVYSQTLTASGGTALYTYSVVAGSLPAGLSLNTTTGVLSGTPTSAAPASFTVRVTDAKSCTAALPYSIGAVTASLGDYVFEDVNANGVQYAPDKPIPGVTVSLLTSGTLVATTTTDASGLYSFTGLTPGVPYSVSFTAPTGFTATLQNRGINDALDSDGNPATGVTGVYSLTANENNITVDMGYYKPASLGDKVFADNNRNGIQDTGDTPIPGVTVTLVSNGTVVATTTTLSSGTAIGCYSFTGLTPGVPYSVSFTTPAGYTATTPNAPGSTTATDSDPINGVTTSVTLASGENNPTLDAGFIRLTAALGDYVFEDVNANGVQDAPDKPIPGVTVSLLTSGTLVATTTTDASGLYSFTGLTPGVPYSVSFTAPVGFTATTKDSGTNDAADSDGNPATGVTGVYTLTANENNTTVDMGYYKPATLGDKVFADNNKNGIQDTGDTPLAGVTVTLVSNGTVVATTTTLSSGTAIGCYSFTGLTPGVPYSVSFTTPGGYTATTPNAPGSTTATDSDPINGVTTSVTLASGENNPTLDAGFVPNSGLTVVVSSAPVCNSVTNNYTATASVSLTNVLTVSTLTLTDNGTPVGTLSLTVGQTSASFSVSGVSNASSHSLVATLTGGTSASVTYTAPASCTLPVSTKLTLDKMVSLSKARIGDILTYTLVLTNVGTVTANNVVVTDSSTVGLNYVTGSATAPSGTTFTKGSPISTWSVATISAGQSLSMTFQARADSSGILYNKATIPGDTATVCTTVPVKVCAGSLYTFRLEVAPGRSSYKWYRNGVEIVGQITNILDVSAPGSYSLSVDNVSGKCPDFSCCPFIVEEDSLPTFKAVTIPVTCLGNTAQTNGKIVLSGFKASNTYQYSLGTSFNEAASLSGVAKAIPAGGVIASSLANPTVAQAYTVRVYNSSGCYKDVAVMMTPTVCDCPAEVCVPFVIQQNKRAKRIGDPR